MKIIAGCNGYNAQRLADFIRRCWPMQPEDVYAAALDIPFGGHEDLVVITPDKCVFHGDDELHERYFATLQNPEFNPRWESGIPDRFAIVAL